MPDRQVIALLAYRRPAYTRLVLEALARYPGIADYRLIAYTHTPVHRPVLELLEAIDFCEARVLVGDAVGGSTTARVAHATRDLLDHAFADAEYVISLQDDTVPARDCLRYFEWAGAAYASDPAVFTVCGYGVPNGGPHRIHHLPADLRLPLTLDTLEAPDRFRVFRRRHFSAWG